MKRFALALVLLLLCTVRITAQQNVADAPASKEDVQRYLDAMQSRDTMSKMLDSMITVQHQMIHEQFLRDKDKLPPDFEDRMNKFMDDFMKSFPFERIFEEIIPVYQEHFTKGDLEALTAFYSSPTGKKVIRELPAVMAESMQITMPLMQKQIGAMTDGMKQQIAKMEKEGRTTPQPTSN